MQYIFIMNILGERMLDLRHSKQTIIQLNNKFPLGFVEKITHQQAQFESFPLPSKMTCNTHGCSNNSEHGIKEIYGGVLNSTCRTHLVVRTPMVY